MRRSAEEQRICVATYIAEDMHRRLLDQARARGLVHRRSGRPNEAAVIRELLGLGLQVAEQAGPGAVERR